MAEPLSCPHPTTPPAGAAGAYRPSSDQRRKAGYRCARNAQPGGPTMPALDGLRILDLTQYEA
ncbi:MAG: hypothetical protein OXU63_10565, partial [Acidobacteriota bacterium]|nr:hypothetical protein [Acidobacteriota bacterium]